MIIRSLLLAALVFSGSAWAGASQPLPPPYFPAPARHVAREQANLRLVYRFYQDFFVHHRLAAAQRDLAPDYIQHNPLVPDGRAAFVEYFMAHFKEHPQSTVSISQYGTFGDRVFLRVHSQDDPHDRGYAIVDIFRVAHGRIVEHWDSVQAVPASAANGNTMF